MKIILSLILLCFTFTLSAQSYKKGEVLLSLTERTNPKHMTSALPAELREAGFTLQECIAKELNYWLAVFDTSRISDQRVMELLPLVHGISDYQWNHTNIETRETTPDDPLLTGQWHHSRIKSPQAWDISTGGKTLDGKEIVMAVVDVSFDIAHGDLKFYKNSHEIPNNGLDDDQNGYIDDYDGWNAYGDSGQVGLKNAFGSFDAHGTMVCGVGGAIGNNRRDGAGINWDVKILPVQGSSTVESVVLKAYDYILAVRRRYNRTNGDSGAFITVINSSFGVNYGQPSAYPLWCKMYDTLGKEGMLSVVAGPNANMDIDVLGDIPCTCPSDYVISVTLSNTADGKGTGGYGIKHMDILAPGTEILTTTPLNQTGKGTGTSYAAPMVSGAIALMYSVLPQHLISEIPDLLALRMKRYLLKNGVDTLQHMLNLATSGGRLNLFKAVVAARDGGEIAIRENLPASKFHLYPNPAIDFVRIAGHHNYTDTSYIIKDITGRFVASGKIQNGYLTNVQSWSSGLYYVMLESNSEWIVMPLLVN